MHILFREQAALSIGEHKYTDRFFPCAQRNQKRIANHGSFCAHIVQHNGFTTIKYLVN